MQQQVRLNTLVCDVPVPAILQRLRASGSEARWRVLSHRARRTVVAVSCNGRTLVARASDDFEKILSERACQQLAHECGLAAAPTVVEPVGEGWHFFSERFIGTPRRARTVQDTNRRALAELAERLGCYYRCAPTNGQIRVLPPTHARLMKWIELSRELGIPLSTRQQRLPDLLSMRDPQFPCTPVHGDLRMLNLVHEAGSLYLVDFEHAGLGNPAFDLAKLTMSRRLPRSTFEEFARRAYGMGAETAIEAAGLYREAHQVAIAVWRSRQQERKEAT